MSKSSTLMRYTAYLEAQIREGCRNKSELVSRSSRWFRRKGVRVSKKLWPGIQGIINRQLAKVEESELKQLWVRYGFAEKDLEIVQGYGIVASHLEDSEMRRQVAILLEEMKGL